MPKLLYLLRTSDCSDDPLLSQFDFSAIRNSVNPLIEAQPTASIGTPELELDPPPHQLT